MKQSNYVQRYLAIFNEVKKTVKSQIRGPPCIEKGNRYLKKDDINNDGLKKMANNKSRAMEDILSKNFKVLFIKIEGILALIVIKKSQNFKYADLMAISCQIKFYYANWIIII